jgi:AcrR family transcriptional regulator
MGRRVSQKVVSRDEVLKAATGEFIEEGFHGARMDRIARRGGFNKAMIYYHFKSKESIYQEVLRHVVTTVLTTLNSAARNPASVDELIGHIYDTYQELAITSPDYLRLTLYEFIRGAPVLKKMKIIRWQDVPFNPINGRIFLFLKARMRDGTIRKMDVFQALLLILGQVIPVVVLAFIKDIFKDSKLPLDPSLIIGKILSERRAVVIDSTMRALAPDKGGKR